MQTFTFSRQRLRGSEKQEERQVIKQRFSFQTRGARQGAVVGTGSRSGQYLTGPKPLFNTHVIRKEYDLVKSYGHASLFNEHYLSQRTVYAQELAGASPNLKGKKCGAYSI